MRKRKEYLDKHKWEIYQDNQSYWCTYLPDPTKRNGRRKVRRRFKEDVEKAVINYWKNDLENPTFEVLFNRWNDKRLQDGAIEPSTHDQNRMVYRRFCTDFGQRRIKDLKAMDVLDFLESVPEAAHKKEGRPLSSKAFTALKVIVKGTLKRARREELTSISVTDIFDDLDVSPKRLAQRSVSEEDDVFTEEELPKFMTYLKEHPDPQNLGILLMIYTGIRVGELAALKHSDVLEGADGYQINVERTETAYTGEDGKRIYTVRDHTKTPAGVRKVVVPTGAYWLIRKLETLNPFGEYIFVNAKGERLTTNAFRARQKRVCSWIGIKPKSPHKSRKTYASLLLNNSCDLNFIKNQMGHTDITTTESFYHKDMRSIRRKTEILDQMLQFRGNEAG